MSQTAFLVLSLGLLLIASIAVLAGTRINEYLNTHRWILPAICALLVVVIVIESGGLAGKVHHSQVSACERANPEKVSEIKNLEHDRGFYRVLRTVVKKKAEDPAVKFVLTKALAAVISWKSEAIGEKVQARAQFSEHPGGPPAEAVIVDCEAAYPSS